MKAAVSINSKRRTPAILGMLLLVATLAFGQKSATPEAGMTAAPSWPLWDAYKSHFLDASGRVIDHDAGDRTTSEGQAYAMFFSLVGNDRPSFDRLLEWTVENLAQGDLTAHLPAWEWGHASDGAWRVLDANSAADADLWTSYALLQAGRLWHQPRYRALGLALAAQISQREVRELPGLGWTLLPGVTGFEAVDRPAQASAPDTGGKRAHKHDSQAGIWILNPSYSPLPVLTGMAEADPHGPWRAIAEQLPILLEKSSVRGFAMDWVSYRANGSFLPAVLPGSPAAVQPVGSYDAIRVYLWAGIAPATMPGSRAVLHASSGMLRYSTEHSIPPRAVDALGNVTAADGPVGFSAALLPYLAAFHAKPGVMQQQNRLAALRDKKNELYGSPPRYYDQNLVLFSEGWQQRRYRFLADGELRVPWSNEAAHERKLQHSLLATRQPESIR